MKADPNLPHRLITRHPSNEGSVITFDMYGCTVELFVADAKYRAKKRWGKYCNRPTLSDLIADFKSINPDKKHLRDFTLTDSQLQDKFSAFIRDKTAKENTDYLMQFENTEAAHHCRDQNIPGIGPLDLPNMYELMVLYLESDRLDALDSTIFSDKSNVNFALGFLNPNSYFNFEYCSGMWASTEYNSNFAFSFDCVGREGIDLKSYRLGVIPVRELNVV